MFKRGIVHKCCPSFRLEWEGSESAWKFYTTAHTCADSSEPFKKRFNSLNPKISSSNFLFPIPSHHIISFKKLKGKINRTKKKNLLPSRQNVGYLKTQRKRKEKLMRDTRQHLIMQHLNPSSFSSLFYFG